MNDAELLELAARVGAGLQERQLMLATAESCTGGLIAGAITATAGSSAWFDRGFVTYSYASKIEVLGVPAACLEQFGAVSEATARAMVEGALERSQGQVAVAVTGIAGPAGGMPDKPVGMVCFGWALRGRATETATVHFSGDRAAIRALTVRHALEGILIRLDSHPSGG